MIKIVVEKTMVFLSQICIKVILSNPQNKATLKHTTHAVSVLSLQYFYIQAKLSPPKIALVEIMLPKINRQRCWNKNVLGGKFLRD